MLKFFTQLKNKNWKLMSSLKTDSNNRLKEMDFINNLSLLTFGFGIHIISCFKSSCPLNCLIIFRELVWKDIFFNSIKFKTGAWNLFKFRIFCTNFFQSRTALVDIYQQNMKEKLFTTSRSRILFPLFMTFARSKRVPKGRSLNAKVKPK